jgi:hypothetical protein
MPCGTRQHPPNGWEFSHSGFNGQKRSKMNAIVIDTMPQRYGWGWGLSTALAGRRHDVFEPNLGAMVLSQPLQAKSLVKARVRRKMPGGFKPKKTNVRKLSFAPNHLFPYLVPRDRGPAKMGP